MKYQLTWLAAAVTALGVAGAAQAGGFGAPVVEVAPVAVETAPVSDWAGAYVGGTVGYAFGGDDEVGFRFYENGALDEVVNGLTDLEVKGANAGLHLGYAWQRGQWVYGPELGVEFGKIDAKKDGIDEDGDYSAIESKVNHILSLRIKGGYLVNPQTLVFGTAGAVRGDFDYKLAGPDGSATEGYSANGYSVGLGVERKLTERLSLTGEWEYRNFGKTKITYTDGVDSLTTNATPEHHNVKLGLNFSF